MQGHPRGSAGGLGWCCWLTVQKRKRAESATCRACTAAPCMVPNAALVLAPVVKFRVSEVFGLLGLKWLKLLKVSTRSSSDLPSEMRVETFNTFNHFNPNNPNTSLTWNFTTGAQTNAAFGTIQGAQVQARHVALSARFKF